MKKTYTEYYLLICIIFLGLFLRLLGIIKPFGLGYDEAITYIYAIKDFPMGIINSLVKTDVHMPLYFLILNLWIKLFTNSDTIMRLLSVLFGILSIFLCYLSGKELVNKKTGLIAALLISVNSLAIFYSQEVRFYSLLMMLSALTLLYFIKTINNPSKINLILLFFSSILLIYTNTISIIFVTLILFETALLLMVKYKEKLFFYIYLLLLVQIFLLPFYWMIYQISIHRGSAFSDVLFFDNQVIFGIIQSWFSPILVGLYNNPQNYFINFFKNISVQLTIFALIPMLISIILMLKNNFKKPVNAIILSTIVIFISIELVASYMHKFTILPRYTLFVLPFIVILVASGLNNYKHKIIADFLFITLILINLFYLVIYPDSAPKIPRTSGQKVPAMILKEYKINNHDIVIYPLRTNLSDKYYQNNYTKLSTLQIFSELYPYKDSVQNQHAYYKKIFNDNNSKIFKNYFDNEIYKKLAPKCRLVLLIQKDFMPYNVNSFNYVLKNNNIYNTQPILFMKLYKTVSNIVANSYKLKMKKVYNIENWMIIIYEKRSD